MDKNLTCDFCGKNFKRESFYLKHKCEQMRRYDLFKKPIGHLAYLIFNQWRKICGYPSVTVDIFSKSRYFNAFVNFAEFCRKQSIPDKISYIELMVEKKLQPFNWCDIDVYDYYIAHFDREIDVDEKVNLSIETLKDLADKHECNISEVFDKITPIQILRLITARKLSPWLLLPSKKFMDFMIYKTNKEERLLFNTFINVEEWKKYFLENPDKVLEIKDINRKMGL